jgi:hypothetical protein
MKEHLFQKKLTVIETDRGFAVAVYGTPTGQVYSTPEMAHAQIEKLKEEARKKSLRKAAEKRKLQSKK